MQEFKLRPSWLLTAILVTGHGAATTIVMIVGMPSWIMLIASAAIMLNCLYSVRRAALLLAPSSAAAVEIDSDNLLSIRTRDGEWTECEVLDSTYVAPFLTVLNLSETGKRAIRHVVIMPDGIDREDFRKLRVWLRWQRGPQPGR